MDVFIFMSSGLGEGRSAECGDRHRYAECVGAVGYQQFGAGFIDTKDGDGGNLGDQRSSEGVNGVRYDGESVVGEYGDGDFAELADDRGE